MAAMQVHAAEGVTNRIIGFGDSHGDKMEFSGDAMKLARLSSLQTLTQKPDIQTATPSNLIMAMNKFGGTALKVSEAEQVAAVAAGAKSIDNDMSRG